MKKYIVDRFEEDFVVLEEETGGSINIKRELLPDANRGDVLTEENGAFIIDEQETLERKKRISEKMNKLFEKKKNL
ncbi:MAG: DUF3006 domain-containing protein [Clostridia bacterium]|nr:DUF3006 domain-containing protein [Clostridia bacterium]